MKTHEEVENAMRGIYKAVPLTDRVYWVGAVDWNIRDFHGYRTKRGSTYNAYLIMAEKPILIDTVKKPFYDELMARISSVLDPRDIKVVVSLHSEMDHSGCLPEVIKAVEPEEAYASVMGAKTLDVIFRGSVNIRPVKDGETLSLGNARLTFMETRMLHWPDSMISYLHEDGVLFSQDAFGMHLATTERYADEIDESILLYEGATYFANILMPYAGLVIKLIDRIGTTGWKFNLLAPDHGPVWRRDIDQAVALYQRWAVRKPARKAVVVYGTMWHSTELMARHIGEGLAAGGVAVKIMSMDACHRSDVAYEVLDAAALVVGSSTLNNHMLPSVADVMTYLRGLRPQGLLGATFGSYGWSGEAAGHIQDILREMKVEVVMDPLRVRQVPDEKTLSDCHHLGRRLAEEIRQRI